MESAFQGEAPAFNAGALLILSPCLGLMAKRGTVEFRGRASGSAQKVAPARGQLCVKVMFCESG